MLPDPKTSDADDPSDTRCGYVALIGRPNAGKSTLLNAALGTHLSIVTPKPQTTWRRVTGILTTERVQIVFVDTPGILRVEGIFQRAMLHEAEQAIEDADVHLLLLDATRPLATDERDVLEGLLGGGSRPLLVAVNKTDQAEGTAVETEERWAREAFPRAQIRRISALTGDGVDSLIEDVGDRIPVGPFLFPPDEIATDPVRFFVAELVRETVFEQYREEIPYSTISRVEEFREGGKRTYIQVTLYVERRSQRGILIGDKGAAIRSLGVEARKKIEEFLGEPVYLDLWVKVLPHWRRRRKELRRLGFRVPEDHEETSAKGT